MSYIIKYPSLSIFIGLICILFQPINFLCCCHLAKKVGRAWLALSLINHEWIATHNQVYDVLRWVEGSLSVPLVEINYAPCLVCRSTSAECFRLCEFRWASSFIHTALCCFSIFCVLVSFAACSICFIYKWIKYMEVNSFFSIKFDLKFVSEAPVTKIKWLISGFYIPIIWKLVYIVQPGSSLVRH